MRLCVGVRLDGKSCTAKVSRYSYQELEAYPLCAVHWKSQGPAGRWVWTWWKAEHGNDPFPSLDGEKMMDLLRGIARAIITRKPQCLGDAAVVTAFEGATEDAFMAFDRKREKRRQQSELRRVSRLSRAAHNRAMAAMEGEE